MRIETTLARCQRDTSENDYSEDDYSEDDNSGERLVKLNVIGQGSDERETRKRKLKFFNQIKEKSYLTRIEPEKEKTENTSKIR